MNRAKKNKRKSRSEVGGGAGEVDAADRDGTEEVEVEANEVDRQGKRS